MTREELAGKLRKLSEWAEMEANRDWLLEAALELERTPALDDLLAACRMVREALDEDRGREGPGA